MKSNLENNFISIVVYLYNDETHIESFLKNIISILSQNFYAFEIICVNDKSKDSTIQIIRDYAHKVGKSNITILNMSYHQGIESSMNAGVDISIGDYVIQFDSCYLYYDNDVILKAYYEVLKGNDIVIGVSDQKPYFSSRIFYKLFNQFSHYQHSLETLSFIVLSRRALNRVTSLNKTIPYRKAVYLNSGLKTESYKFKTNQNELQKAKIRRKRLSIALDSLILFTDIAQSCTIIMTSIMMLVTLLTIIYAVVMFLAGIAIPGWTTTMLFFAFCFLALFIILSIIVKYLSIIVNLIFKQQNYNFESIEKL